MTATRDGHIPPAGRPAPVKRERALDVQHQRSLAVISTRQWSMRLGLQLNILMNRGRHF